MPVTTAPPALQVKLDDLVGTKHSSGKNENENINQSESKNVTQPGDGIFARVKEFDYRVLFESPWMFIEIGVLVLIFLLIVLLIFCYGVRMYRNRKAKERPDLFKAMSRRTKRNVLGHVDLILSYDYTQAILGVELLQVRDLKLGKNSVEEKELEVYCLISLLPDLKKIEKTKIVSKSFSPSFHEKFELKCVIDDLDYKQVLIRAIRHFKCLRDAPIGDAVMKLSKTDLQLGYASIPILSYNPNLDDPLGEICVTLRYNGSTKKLGITILECKDLKVRDWGGSLDPYCTCTVKIGDKVVGKDTSQTIKKTRNPYFNAVFSYKVAPNKLSSVDVLIKVKDKDFFGGAQELGSIRFGKEPDTEKAERQWSQMIEYLRKPQTEWHYLMMSEK